MSEITNEQRIMALEERYIDVVSTLETITATIHALNERVSMLAQIVKGDGK